MGFLKWGTLAPVAASCLSPSAKALQGPPRKAEQTPPGLNVLTASTVKGLIANSADTATTDLQKVIAFGTCRRSAFEPRFKTGKRGCRAWLHSDL
jgi:hypothetical protein